MSTKDTPRTAPSMNCPTCKKQVIMNEQFPHRPFCSHRCQLIDLGEWAAENHRIAGSHNDEDDLWSDAADPFGPTDKP